eukprot:Gb_04145 [translate_table: standard]
MLIALGSCPWSDASLVTRLAQSRGATMHVSATTSSTLALPLNFGEPRNASPVGFESTHLKAELSSRAISDGSLTGGSHGGRYTPIFQGIEQWPLKKFRKQVPCNACSRGSAIMVIRLHACRSLITNIVTAPITGVYPANNLLFNEFWTSCRNYQFNWLSIMLAWISIDGCVLKLFYLVFPVGVTMLAMFFARAPKCIKGDIVGRIGNSTDHGGDYVANKSPINALGFAQKPPGRKIMLQFHPAPCLLNPCRVVLKFISLPLHPRRF